MTRLDDAFAQLAERGEPRSPVAVLGAARTRATQMRRRRRAAVGAATVALVLTAGLVGWNAGGGESRTELDSGLADRPASVPGPDTPTPDPQAPGPGPDLVGADPAPPGTDPAPPAGDRAEVQVFFLSSSERSCAATVPVTRIVDAPAVLQGALEQLLRGPTEEEEAAGVRSSFSAVTAGSLRSVSIVEGVALVDLAGALGDALPETSTTCGGTALLAQLDATVTQFPRVERAVYSYDGDVAAFYGRFGGVAPDGSHATPEADGVPSWPGSLGLGPDGAVDRGDLGAHLASVDPTGGLSADAVASLALHLEQARADGALVLVEDRHDGDLRTVTVTLSHLRDDSVAAIRYDLQLVMAPGTTADVVGATWSQRCRDGRGQQDFAPAPCT